MARQRRTFFTRPSYTEAVKLLNCGAALALMDSQVMQRAMRIFSRMN
jgi:hypothetical protein